MIEVLFEDTEILAIAKPAGIPSQGTIDPKRASVFSLIQEQMKGQKLYLIHRLDRDTSGVMLLSKTPAANKYFTELFRQHEIQKTYLAICKSEKLAPPFQFQIKNYLAPVRGKNNLLKRMVEVKKGGWYAETEFRILENFGERIFIQAQPKTGRTHQIRVHLAGNKLPILGDNLYGGKSSEVPRLMLHALKIAFTHPLTKVYMTIECPLTSDFNKILENLKNASAKIQAAKP